ncbi:MAG TPA: hypothetical protein VD704_02345 [Gaiellaceae bacterium]|nr:hypothetical protein [Gaiellaceae bacterium]
MSAVRYPPSARWDRPGTLAVRPHRSSKLLLIVQAHQVESVSLADRRIVLRSSPTVEAPERASASGRAIESPDTAPSPDEDTRAYWLSVCEGFRVDSKDGRVGIVEEVRLSSDKQPEALAVRTGLFRTRLLIVAAREVERVVPQSKQIFLSSTTS